MCDFSRMQLKSHVIAYCAAGLSLMQFLLHAIKIALIKQVRFYRMQLHAFALCRKGVRLDLVQCDNCHNQSQTCHKSHAKWNVATSGVVVDAILNKIAGYYRRVCGLRATMVRRKQKLTRSCNCDGIAKVCGGLNLTILEKFTFQILKKYMTIVNFSVVYWIDRSNKR